MSHSNINLTNTFTFYIIIEQNQYERHTLYHQLSVKSGKTLFSFDLYDGTSTITCKAFLNRENAKKIMKRKQGAKGIKIAGTAQMDTL